MDRARNSNQVAEPKHGTGLEFVPMDVVHWLNSMPRFPLRMVRHLDALRDYKGGQS